MFVSRKAIPSNLSLSPSASHGITLSKMLPKLSLQFPIDSAVSKQYLEYLKYFTFKEKVGFV